MNEKRIREVIEAEQRALDLVAKANREAELIPSEAQAQAAAIIAHARSAAQEEARQIIELAQQGTEADSTLSRAQESMNKSAALAGKNFEQAVAHVLDSVLGRE